MKIKDITFYGRVTVGIIVIAAIIVAIFTFRKVYHPALDGSDQYKKSIDSLKKVIINQEAAHKYQDSIRKRENDSLIISNEILKGTIKTNTIYSEKIIERIGGYDAAQLEQFFSDRYKK